MTEKEYIQLSNRIYISNALNSIREIIPNKNITSELKMLIIENLSKIEQELFKKVKIDE